MATVAAAHHVQTVVIGAGVIGLSIARALAIKGQEVLILEASSRIGSGTSSRNSEVIHAGLYYPKDSRKAQHCVQGKLLLYDYLKDRHIPFDNCGKLVVAKSGGDQKSKLIHFKNQAIQNGVNDIKVLSKEDVQVLEPELCCEEGALWSPSTGVLDSHSFLVALLADAELHGATLSLSTTVNGGRVTRRGEELGNVVLHTDGLDLHCDMVVNCAGLDAHEVAQRIHAQTCSSTQWTPPQQYFAKGNYFRLQQRKVQPFSHLVYPLPESGGLGVHATIDWAGTATKFGPDVEWIDPAMKLKDIDLTVDEGRADAFYGAIRSYWPSLPDGALSPDYAGIRAKLYHPSLNKTTLTDQTDFVIADSKEHGIPGMYHFFGIESPGLTSSLSIANYVADRCAIENT